MSDVLLQYDHSVPVVFVSAQNLRAEQFLLKYFKKTKFRLPKLDSKLLTEALECVNLKWSLERL